MGKYTSDELSDALEVISSTISKCEKIQPKFAEGTSQYTLLKNRIKAMYISKTLITEDCEIERYSKEELINALKPVASVISKCETAQRKHDLESFHYKNLQNIIDAMKIANSLIADEIRKRST
jgi:predicted transcriptional regulator